MLLSRLLASVAAGGLVVLGMAAGASAASNPVVNGGFETGSFSGWSTSGASTTIVSSGAHSGNFAAMAGSTSATAGDSNIFQTFTAAVGDTTLSFWYNVTCPDTVTFDWATATLTDNTSGTTSTPLARTCVSNSGWQKVTTPIMAGHSYTLTLTSHDDNNPGDPTFTLFDDVAAAGSDTVTVTNPGNQSSFQNSSLSLQMSGSSSGGFSLSWSASGLPAGLAINASTGLISGKVTATPGTYFVTVTAADTNGASNSASFNWNVLSDVGSPVKNSASAKCLNDSNGGSVTPGNPIVIWTCITNGPNEKFSHPANPGELVVYGQCVTDPAGGGSGTKQVIEPCTGAPSQMWFHNSTLEYVLTANGLCLTDPGSSTLNGTQQVVKTCKNVSNQHWKGR
jgi:Putative Ig domain/Ricin-type beta-trefoil lectin domain